jgi:hypothetical protein
MAHMESTRTKTLLCIVGGLLAALVTIVVMNLGVVASHL